MRFTIVAGEVVCEDNQDTGARAGIVLRSGVH
jgi:hypothetical protein